jgi:ABC-type antimicrobial peptide transport system permease subunit
MKLVHKSLKTVKISLKLFSQTLSFIVLLLAYMMSKLVVWLARFTPNFIKNILAKPMNNIWNKLLQLLERDRGKTISRINLIELSLRNLQVKKTRTLITIGGMALGVGAIVFLVSIGFGLQNVVVSRVAGLEELRQAEVTAPSGGKLTIDDQALSNFENLESVSSALPLISVVGRVTYKSAVSDMAVYGVTTEYLEQSAIQPVHGKVFDNDQLVLSGNVSTQSGRVAGVSTEEKEFGREVRKVQFNLQPGYWLKVRKEPTTESEVLGYTKRVEGVQAGKEVWGDEYQTEEGESSKWINGDFLIWQVKGGEYQPVKQAGEKQEQTVGYIAEIGTQIFSLGTESGQVLGETSEGGETIDWIEVATESGKKEDEQTTIVELPDDDIHQAVVNRAMLKVLGLEEEQAVGKKFEASFVAMGEDLNKKGEKVKSAPTQYEIVGVIPGDKTPLFYVPFVDLRQLGVVNYNQAKVVVSQKEALPQVRQQIEAMGFVTRSVTDTVKQIKGLFSTARTVLGMLGMTALIVASLGMFNTLTVSLLERTREVGLMKALGMKSDEVKELFLTESMIMGFFGGILGIAIGFGAGKLLSLFVSVFSLAKGVGMINLSVIPISFLGLIVFLSLFVGITTGLYPAKRATKISPLNALRYE